MCEEDKKEIERLKGGIYAVVAGLVNKKPCTTLALARTVMYGGSVLSALDIEKFGGGPGGPKWPGRSKYKSTIGGGRGEVPVANR